MAATAEVRVFHGVTPTGTATTEVRHKRADNSTLDLLNQIPIPSSGVSRGWPKHFKLFFTTTPSTQISNLRWYMESRPTGWDGITLFAGLTASYAQAVVTDENALRPGLSDADLYTAAAPLVVAGGTILTNPSTGDGGVLQPYLQVQMTLTPTTTPGVKPARHGFFRYDES